MVCAVGETIARSLAAPYIPHAPLVQYTYLQVQAVVVCCGGQLFFGIGKIIFSSVSNLLRGIERIGIGQAL